MNDKFIISGNKPLKGNVDIRGAKNAAFPILAATLLTDEPCVIDNIPLIEDVFKMLKILEGLGAEISWLSERKIRIRCRDIDFNNLPKELISCFRGSILLVGPLLARFNKITIPLPGGCLIGARSLDAHIDSLSQVGVNSAEKNKFYFFEKKSIIRKKEVVLREFSVTATENILLFSSCGNARIVLKIADVDYQVQELIKVLNKMGAKIKENGSHSFEIVGRKKLKGFNHFIISDPIETATFILAALATKGTVLIKKAEISFLTLFLKRLKDFGADFKIINYNSIKIFPGKKLKIDKIQSLPYPGIHSDIQPELGVLATQAIGPTLIHDPLFEGRLKYLEELNKMGADIIFCDPHRAIINGPTLLKGIDMNTLDLRAGAAFIIAGLIAKGRTTINNIYQIDRGYEKIEERLQKLGADIKRE